MTSAGFPRAALFDLGVRWMLMAYNSSNPFRYTFFKAINRFGFCIMFIKKKSNLRLFFMPSPY